MAKKFVRQWLRFTMLEYRELFKAQCLKRGPTQNEGARVLFAEILDAQFKVPHRYTFDLRARAKAKAKGKGQNSHAYTGVNITPEQKKAVKAKTVETEAFTFSHGVASVPLMVIYYLEEVLNVQ
jgi:hypothetical protein